MRLQTVILLVLLTSVVLCKRGSRGRSRSSSSSSSSSFWTRKSKSESKSSGTKPVQAQPKPIETQAKPAVNQPKPSAPNEPPIKKDAATSQQNAPNSKPIGWNVDNSPPSGHGAPPAYNAAPPAYGQSHVGAPPAYSYGAPPAYSYGQSHVGAPPAYGYGAPPAYGQPHAGAPPSYQSHGFPNTGHGYPGAPPAYNQPYGYGNQGYGGVGYPQQQQTGLMGSMFGGNRHGYGGYGGFGGGYGGYGMKKSGGFFGKHAFRNVLGGLFVWYLISGLVKTPYKVYNYYNMPEHVEKEMTLPANVLTLCNENATNICVPGTTAICTQDNKIMCVTTLNQAAPCGENGQLCVNSTIPCLDANDPLCQNKTTPDNTTTVNLPCFANVTVQKQADAPSNVTLPNGETKFCVTAMAVPDPSIPVEPEITTANSTMSTGAVNGTAPSVI